MVKVEDTVTVLQGALVEPVRQGATLFAVIRAFVAGLRGPTGHSHHRREDEEALFVG